MTIDELEREITKILSEQESCLTKEQCPYFLNELFAEAAIQTVYQPIVNHTNHTLVGVEALSRPNVRGVSIRPDLWFYAAYLSKRSVEADSIVLQSSVGHIRFLKHFDGCRLFVNVMPSSLLDRAFLKRLEIMLEQGLYRPHDLVIEIVEYVPYDPVTLANCIKSLRTLGIQIALDDINLQGVLSETLTELSPDYVKFDRSIIKDILISKGERHRLSSLIRDFGDQITFVAEGIEDLKDLLVIQELGIHLSQGYYWTRPMPASEELYLWTKIKLTKSRLLMSCTINEGIVIDRCGHRNNSGIG